MNKYVASLIYNNLGCLHLFLNKPNLASYYFCTGFKEHYIQLKENEEYAQRPDIHHYSRKVDFLYNQAIAQLHMGQFEKAFSDFLNCSQLLRSHPQFWLHVAECCIAACSEENDRIDNLLRKREESDAIEKDMLRLGFQVLETPAQSQKQYILKTPAQRHSSIYNTGDGHSSAKPALTLPFASTCLRNANFLVTALENEPNAPNSLPITSKLYLLKAVILIKQSYVSLRLGDPCMAAKYSQEVLMKHTQIPGGYLALAKLYAAESLVLLDKMSEAIEILDPTTVSDVGFECNAAGKDPSVEEKANRSNVSASSAQESLMATRAVFTFNLAAAFMLRGELDKADGLLDQLWNTRANHQIGIKVFQAQLYVQLKKGNIQQCREKIQKNCLTKF